MRDAPRPGRKKGTSEELVKKIVEKTLRSAPVGQTHWSTRTMAKEVGISHDSIHQIWKQHGLAPYRVQTFKFSKDPRFGEKLRDVVGPYLDPPEKALVPSVDEKSQIQALEREADRICR